MDEVSTLTEVITLVGAVTGLVTALAALVGAFTLLFKTLRKAPARAAKTVVDRLAAAAEDGDITAEELRDIADHAGERAP